MTTSPLTALEQALLGPVNNFLTALQQPGVNIQTAVQQLGGLSLSEMLALPGAESALINLVAASLQTKINSALTPTTSAQ